MNKIIIITGASRGIGRAMAQELSKENIVIANYNKSIEQAKSLVMGNPNIDAFKADVSNRNECNNLVNYVISKYGRIDVLINNAGVAQEKLFQNITDQDFAYIIKNNLYSVFCMTQAVIPYMIHAKSGCIINISSIYSVYGGSYATAYSASKGGVDGFTKSLAKELAPSHIRVNSIAPGIINTDMNSNLSQEDINEIIQDIPLNRIGEGIDIAKCANWLINDEYTTGQIIQVDGGWKL